jgi:GntR family transcriptional regulator/MocR family aminotransferase
MLSATRGLAADADNVLVTRGSQMALYLAARTLIAPGDVVAVEDPGYRPAWEAFRLAGAHLVPLPVDVRGLSLDALAHLCARQRVRAVYVTPHHQYPTMATLAPGRRLELLDLARSAKMAIIEDDYDHEFHYEGRPVLPLASADRAGTVIYVGTLSKVLAPGLRVGYIVAPPPLIKHVAALRSFVDLQGDHAQEAAIAELLEDGVVLRHIRRARRIYERRRDVLADELTAHLGHAVSFDVPPGGIAIWARIARGIDVSAWERAAQARRVAFQPGARFAFDGTSTPHLRLGFASLDETALREGVRRLAACVPVSGRRSRSRS